MLLWFRLEAGSEWRVALLVFDGNRLNPKHRRDGGGLGQPAQYVLYQLHQRQHGRLQPFLLWFIVCWTNVNCFHHWQLCERLDVPRLTLCLPLNVCLCPYGSPTMPASLLTPPLAHLSAVRRSLFLMFPAQCHQIKHLSFVWFTIFSFKFMDLWHLQNYEKRNYILCTILHT